MSYQKILMANPIIAVGRIATTLLGVWLGMMILPAAAAPSQRAPNIVLVMTDDQGYGDLACHGHPFVKTPNLDRLWTESTRFTSFHVSPTCSPTRSALMSGRAPFKNGITHTIFERERMTLKATTIAQVLKSAGYATGIFGKWHLGDEEEYQPGKRGFDEVFIHGAGGIGQSYPGSQREPEGTGYFDPILRHNGTFVRTKGYCTDVFFQQALGWIRGRANAEQPFFAYIPTNAPHSPYIVADRYRDLYKDKCPPQSAAFYGMITNIDENIGVLLAKLDKWDLARNTLVVFMTDNGSAAGTFSCGMKGRKGSPHEGGSRVPLFMRLPGRFKAGVDVTRMTRHYDLFPTLAEIAGAKIPDGLDLDGRSLMPLIENPSAEWPHRYTFFHVGRWGRKDMPNQNKGPIGPDEAKYRGFAVRDERWRMVGRDQLYDIQADPGEKRNVIDRHPEVAAAMLKAYEGWWSEVRPLLVNEDARLNPEGSFAHAYEKQKAAGPIPAWKAPVLDER